MPAITEKVGAQSLIELTCNPALTGFTLPKMLWVREHEPEVWQQTRSVLLPKDYVRLRLSGDKATDVADASAHSAAGRLGAKMVRRDAGRDRDRRKTSAGSLRIA
jgi:sugar (pentulose or hexulose) kinase